MVRNIVVLGGSSHPQLNDTICDTLGIQQGKALFAKFAVGETRVSIGESVRGKDVYIIQSGGGRVNDHFMELLIAISACRTASATKVTAVLPLFPYSRQSDVPYNKAGAPLIKASSAVSRTNTGERGIDNPYTFESTPGTPHPEHHHGVNSYMNGHSLHKAVSRLGMHEAENASHFEHSRSRATSTASPTAHTNGVPNHDFAVEPKETEIISQNEVFKPRPGYRQWVAQAGTLIADLLTCAGADHVITMDLHDPQYQGFFDIPVDNLYGRPLLKKYIQQHIPEFGTSIIVSPDAGGAKRATAIADSLGMDFALIHKERRPTQITERQNATMMLVGDVAGKTAILIDDLADTCNTITRAAKLLRKEGAKRIIALITHGVFSGDAIERINASALDRVVVTNTIDQSEHCRKCPKLEVLEVGTIFAEVSRAPQSRRDFANCVRQFDVFIMERVSVSCFSTIERFPRTFMLRFTRRQESVLGKCIAIFSMFEILVDSFSSQIACVH